MPQQSAARSAVIKKVRELDDLIRDIYITNLEDYHIPIIQEIILQEYDQELTGRVTDRRSRTNPIYYRDEFREALLNFDYIKTTSKETILIVPETNTFNWRQGRLRVVENILEGMIGNFIEVDEEQYMSMFDKRPIIQPFDGTVPLKERIYLLRLTGNVQRRWRDIYPRDNIVKYPFSNQPPIDIFDQANIYVKENIKSWQEKAIKQAQKEIK